MAERVLTKKNLISFGLFAIWFHIIVIFFLWFTNMEWLYIIDYSFLGLMGFASILFIARQQKPIRYQPAQVILVLFMAWYIISCLDMTITFHSDWVNLNSPGMLNTAICLFLAFPLGYIMIREQETSVAKVLLHILLIGWTIFIMFILINIFQGKTIPTLNNGIIRMKDGCLEMNCNRNTTGSWELLFFMGCCFMVFCSKSLPVKIAYGVFSVIHYIGLTLSNCRAGFLAAFIGFMAIVGIGVYLWLEKKNKPHSLLIAIIIALIAGAAFYFLSGPVFSLYNACTGAQLSGRTGAEQDQTFSGREEVWQYAVEGIFASFRAAVFGYTPASVPEMISQLSNGAKSVYTHNQFLEIAAGIGIPGLCIFLVWFYMIMRDSYKMFFVQKNRTLLLIAPVFIVALMLTNMMEAYLVFFDHISAFVFFLLCGIVYGHINEPIKTQMLSRQAMRNKQRKKKK